MKRSLVSIFAAIALLVASVATSTATSATTSAAASATAQVVAKQAKNQPLPYKNPELSVDERVEDLLGRMTQEEKILQLCQLTLGMNTNWNNLSEAVGDVPAGIGSVIYFDSKPEMHNAMQQRAIAETRLGIPVLFGYDVIHGFRTVYPISLAQACSWSPELVEAACRVAARESRASGVAWTFSPMIDVARDGRWGRISEGYGEDPYTNGVFAVASVRGYQGDDLSDATSVAACLKHYVGYGASEAGKDYFYTEISDQTLWDTYLPPYKMGVDAGAATVMSSFNDISGVPGSANRYLLTEVLKERWGLDGFVVSDWGSIQQLMSQGVAADNKEAALKAFTSGVEMDMNNNAYEPHLADLVAEGLVSQAQIDDAVARVLRLKFDLGLFDDPFVPVTSEAERFLLPESIAAAEALAAESMVLLKNDAGTLPLKRTDRIALIGPMVEGDTHLLGSWSFHGREEDVTGILDGMRAEFGDRAEFVISSGCDFDGDDRSGFAAAVTAAEMADVVVLCLGEKKTWSGENATRSTIALPEIQEQLAAAVAATGKPVVLVLSNGRPLELTRLEPLADAIVEMWQPGVAGGKPLAGILSGRINPSGKLAVTFPRSTGQIPIYYNHRQSARPYGGQGLYQDIPSTPLYEFGYGLSYTTFEYGDIVLPADEFSLNEKFTARITVRNTGSRDGLETVHWYVCDPVCSVSRPVRELKHFEKLMIPAGESRTFEFEIDPARDLAFVDCDGSPILESGEYFIIVGDKKVRLTLNE